MFTEAFTRAVTVTNPHGLHARPSLIIVKTVRNYDAQVTIRRNGQITAENSDLGDLDRRLADSYAGRCVSSSVRIFLAASTMARKFSTGT